MRRRLDVQIHLLKRNWRRYLLPARVLIVSSMLALMGAIVASFSLPPIWLVLACVAGLALGTFACRRVLSCLWAVLPFVFYVNIVLRIPESNNHNLAGAFVNFKAKVVECKNGSDAASNKILVQVQQDNSRDCPTQLAGASCMVERDGVQTLPLHAFPGDSVLIQGRLEPPRHAHYQWQFDYAQFLRYKGVSYICRAVFVRITQHGIFYPILKIFEDARVKLITTQEKLMGSQMAQLLISIVLGDRAVCVGQQTEDCFREVGLCHVLAASGFNLSVVALAARWTMGFVVRRVLWLNLLTIPWVASYDLLAGLSPSILRATLMILLTLGVGSVFRKVHGIAILAACTMISLVIYPGCLQDVGFQLSYLATFGIMSGARELQQVISGRIKRLAFSKWFSEVVSVVMLAQASVLPVQLNYFWDVSLLFLPANLIIDPLLAPLTVLGFASCLMVLCASALQTASTVWTASALWSGGPLFACAGNVLLYLCTVLDRACGLMLQFILTAVKYLAGQNHGAGFCVGPPATCCTAAFLVSLALFTWGLKTRKHVLLLSVTLIVAGASLLFVRPARAGLTIADFGSSVVLLNSQGNCAVLGNPCCRQASSFIRFSGGKQLSTLTSFAINHHAGFDILQSYRGQKILLFDLATLVSRPTLARQVFAFAGRNKDAVSQLMPACDVIPRCKVAVIYNSSGKGMVHEYRSKAASYLSRLVVGCRAKEVLLGVQDSRWLSRSVHFCKNLSGTLYVERPSAHSMPENLPAGVRIILPLDGCNIITSAPDGSFVQ